MLKLPIYLSLIHIYFYFNKENDLVIPFDKYEVAPGYMGTSEFVVDKDLIMKFLHPQMKKILAP